MVDTRQTALASGRKGSLKKIAQSMNFPDWESDNESVVKILKELYSTVFTKSGIKEKNRLIKLSSSWDEFKNSFKSYEDLSSNNQQKLFFMPEVKEEPKEEPVNDKNTTLYNLCTDLEVLYNKTDSIITIEDVKERFLFECRRKNNRLFFDLVPINIISKYCAYDSFAAIKIHNDIWSNLEPREKKAFKYLNEHSKLGAAIECNGVGWNIDYAKYLDKYYQEMLLSSLKGMLSNKLFIVHLDLKTHAITDINSETSLEQLLKVFNPNSTQQKTKDIFSSVMNQDFCRRVYSLWLLYNEVSLTPEDEFTKLKDLFIDLLKESHDLEEMKSIRKEKMLFFNGNINKFKRIIECYVDKYNNFIGQKFLDLLENFNLEHLNDDVVVSLYDAFNRLGGIDIDDKTTWPPEFEVLYYFRIYKKVFKSYSTYLWGNVGMNNDARLIRKEDIGQICPPRLRTDWKKYIEQGDSVDNYQGIVSWGFNVTGADTNRWTSRFHVWPPESELQDLKMSKYTNGLLGHVDYSQMEIRMIAAIAEEKSLLEAYKNGKDVHRFMASQIFNKPESEVDTMERRYSKILTFRLLYGSSEQGIAKELFGGDLKKAKKIVADFYAGLPMISKFVKKQHKGVTNGIKYVRSILGEKIFLKILTKGSERHILSQLKKYSVNTPVQGSASHLAGLGVNGVNKEAFERNLPMGGFGFTHDAGDFDFFAGILFDFLDIIYRQMETNLISEFNIPVKVDIEIGISGYQMLNFDVVEKDTNRLFVKTHGTLKALNKLISCLEAAGLNHDVTIEKETEEFVSNQFLFMKKKSFSRSFGTIKKVVSANLNIYKFN